MPAGVPAPGRNRLSVAPYIERMKPYTLPSSRRAAARAGRRPGPAAVLALVALTATPALAQVEMSAMAEPIGAVFEGTVVDSLTGNPIEGVLVRMDTGQQAFTDRVGRFRFTGLDQGKRLFALLTSDCRITWEEITVVEGIPRDERFRLPPSFGAAAADAARRDEEKQSSMGGRRLTRMDIDESGARNVMELVRQIAPNMLTPMRGEPGGVSEFRSARGRSLGTTDPPVIVIDGVRSPGAEGLLSTMRPNEIAELEIQPGAAAGWEYGSSGASGVIKITMRRGLPDGAEEITARARCVVPQFPRG